MTVQTYLMIRSEGDGTENFPFGPRNADLVPYPSVSWSDATGRASGITDGPLFLSTMQQEPRIMILDVQMSNQDALAMATDPKVWMVVSKRLDEEGEIVETNYDDVYLEAERNVRITQLGNFTDFDVDMISTWWTVDKTRKEVAIKLRNYLRLAV